MRWLTDIKLTYRTYVSFHYECQVYFIFIYLFILLFVFFFVFEQINFISLKFQIKACLVSNKMFGSGERVFHNG